MKFQLKRRLFQLGLASVALATAFPSMAQQKEVEVALIAPMTGPWGAFRRPDVQGRQDGGGGHQRRRRY